jgi:hypothetical protein
MGEAPSPAPPSVDVPDVDLAVPDVDVRLPDVDPPLPDLDLSLPKAPGDPRPVDHGPFETAL